MWKVHTQPGHLQYQCSYREIRGRDKRTPKLLGQLSRHMQWWTRDSASSKAKAQNWHQRFFSDLCVRALACTYEHAHTYACALYTHTLKQNSLSRCWKSSRAWPFHNIFCGQKRWQKKRDCKWAIRHAHWSQAGKTRPKPTHRQTWLERCDQSKEQAEVLVENGTVWS